MDNVSIRQAEVKDISQIINLYLGWQEFKGILPDEIIVPETEECLSPYISGKNSNRRYFVIIDDKQNLIGVCYLDISFESFQVVRIGNFIVDKHHRNKGIGKQMIAYIKNYCKDKNVKKIWLWTQEELVDAIKFYEKNGFVLEGKQKAQFLGKDALVFGLII
jgi:PhnO protein